MVITFGASNISICTAVPYGTVVAYAMFPLSQPVPSYTYDDRFNPKMWAAWFREFLDEHLPKRTAMVFVSSTIRLVHGACARSSTLRQREWKMKLWKQAL